MREQFFKIVPACALLAGCSSNLPNATRTGSIAPDSTMIEIAANNSDRSMNSIPARWNATSKLNEEGRKQLRAQLLLHVQKDFPRPNGVDLYILGQIGNESTARALVNLYGDLPYHLDDFRTDIIRLHTAAAEIRNRLNTHAWEIADDPWVEVEERFKAVARLTELERRELQPLLMARIDLRDRIGGSRAEDIRMLGEVGDENAANWLGTINAPFKLGNTTQLAIDNIEKRLIEQKK